MSYKFDEKNHIHTLNDKPLYGTSTVVKDVMPPFLAKWGAQCAVDFLKDKKNHTEISKGIIQVGDKVLEDAVLAWTKVRKQAAEKGTDMHAELEKYVKACIQNAGKPLGGAWPHKAVEEFSVWSMEHVEVFLASEAHTFSEKLWTGGIVDCIAKMKRKNLAIIDFKSSKEAYFNHFAQVAGYALQIMESGYGAFDGSNWSKLEGTIEELIVVPFGAKVPKPTSITNVQGFMDAFEKIVGVYSLLSAFNKK